MADPRWTRGTGEQSPVVRWSSPPEEATKMISTTRQSSLASQRGTNDGGGMLPRRRHPFSLPHLALMSSAPRSRFGLWWGGHRVRRSPYRSMRGDLGQEVGTALRISREIHGVSCARAAGSVTQEWGRSWQVVPTGKSHRSGSEREAAKAD
jgi:hypothetical protein